jgi:hypothetical protein
LRRDELEELHYITPIGNVRSIIERGILSHKLAAKIQHDSVAKAAIQDRQAKVVVPGGMPLHAYANLYICGRNVMLYLRRGQHREICVLRVSTDILDLPGVVVTDANASSDYVRFAAAPAGLAIVDRELTFAEYWTDLNPIAYYQKKSAKCAEVLVPNSVDAKFLTGAYVSGQEALARMQELELNLPLTMDPHLFFL